MKKILVRIFFSLLVLSATTASAQENLQRGAIASQVKKTFWSAVPYFHFLK